MKTMVICAAAMLLIFASAVCVSAAEFSAPTVPFSAEEWMPEDTSSLNSGIGQMLRRAIPSIGTEFSSALRSGLAVFACVLMVSIIKTTDETISPAELAGAVCISAALFRSSRTMISLAADTVTEISEYSKLFLPVITAACAAQGEISTSTAVYIGTSAFTAFLSSVLHRVMLPIISLFLVTAIANCAFEDNAMKQIRDQIKKLAGWFLKTLLTVFFAYLSITGAVSGTADKAAIKAARTAISTAVPVIGSTLADASEALLVSAGFAKNAIGIYGVFAFLAIILSPFVKIGVNYVILKGTASLCAVLGSKRLSGLVSDFCTALGLLLAVTGTMCALLLIGTVCFMRGIG